MENSNLDITIYSSPGCFYCDQAKELCMRADQTPEVITVGQDITKEEFNRRFPNVMAFPHVIIGGEVIGGLVDFAKYFIKEGIVNARKD